MPTLAVALGEATGGATYPLPVPIVVGSPRSGTTLLRLMLDAHPELAIPPETGFLVLGGELTSNVDCTREQFVQAITAYPPDAPCWGDFHIPVEDFRERLLALDPFSVAEGFRLFYRTYAARFGKPRWGDKTPLYCRYIMDIQALLPEARFIHLIRDGRDAALSLRQVWFSPGHQIDVQARYWRDNILTAQHQGRTCHHYLEVRYEDLLHAPESVLRRVCGFLEMDYHTDMLRFYEHAPQRLSEHLTRRRLDGVIVVTREERLRQQAATCLPLDVSRAGRWTSDLSEEECAQFESIAGDVLQSLGYPVSYTAS
jgi:hypothetical protein